MPKIASGLRIMPGFTGGLLTVQFATASVNYRLVRTLRRTIAIHISHAGLEARAPISVPLKEIEAFMRQKERWILSRMAEMREARPFQWQAGSLLPVLGQNLTLCAAPERTGIAREEARLLIGQPRRSGRHDWRPRVIAWIREQALSRFAQRTEDLARRLDVEMPLVRLSNAAARWGSCSVDRSGARVRLHWKLYLLPPHLIDYVITHELAHIRELNHSHRFWSLVAKLCPDYGAARAELNRRGRALPIL